MTVTYAQTLKPAAVETPLDLAFFRPAAWRVVQLALPTSLSANGMTALSIGAGLVGAGLLVSHDRAVLALAAFLSVLYGVLDCADGQLARARGTSSRVGRILDGMSDYIVGTVSGAAVAAHIGALMGPKGWVLGVTGVASVVLQGTLFDHFKNRYLTMSAASYREGDDLAETLADLAKLKAAGGHHAERVLLSIYAFFLRVQGALGGGRREAPRDAAHAARFAELLRPVARGWAWLGPSTHVFVMGGFVVAGALPAYGWLRLVVGNAVMVGLLIAQRVREREAAAG